MGLNPFFVQITQYWLLPFVFEVESEEEGLKICGQGFKEEEQGKDGPIGRGFQFRAYQSPNWEGQETPEPKWYAICIVNPGNPYPATESPPGPDSLMGQGCQQGYQSHFSIGESFLFFSFLFLLFATRVIFFSSSMMQSLRGFQ